MSQGLRGLRAAILVGKEFEDLELYYPYYRLQEEGVKVDLVAPEKKPYYGKHGIEAVPDKSIEEARPEDYQILVIPGGWAPDRLRRDPRVVEFVREMALREAVIASICHGPQLLISAKILHGRKITCVSAIKDDVINAGAIYLDQPLVVDGNLVSSRGPGDLPYFGKGIIEAAKRLIVEKARP